SCSSFPLLPPLPHSLSFLFTTPPTPDIYTLSLHDALPIWQRARPLAGPHGGRGARPLARDARRVSGARVHAARSSGLASGVNPRSEEHTSELQSRGHLVCRLLLEKKKTT